MEEDRACLKCGSRITGRSDKKFCDSYCRNSYNNKVKRIDEMYIQKVNSILRKNRKILKHFNRVGKTTIKTDYLEKLNFNFRYFTHEYTSKQNVTYKFCYEYGYVKINNHNTLIITEQEYMK